MENTKRFYVYAWVRLDTNKVFYVGKRLGKESYWKGKHLSEETKRKISQARLEKNIPSSQSKEIVVLDLDFNIKETFSSRTLAMDNYDYSVRTCVEYNKEIEDLKDAKIHRTGLIFIYKQDYILLKSQSTIETITLD